MAAKRDLSSFTMTPESTPAGESTAVAAAAGALGAKSCNPSAWIAARVMAAQVSALSTTALRGDVVERSTHSGDQCDGRSVGGFALLRVFTLLTKIEVVARVLGCFHCGPGAITHAEVGETRRNHDGFLRATDEDVHAPGVNIEVGGTEAGDGVHDKKSVTFGRLQQFGNTLYIMARAGGRFSGLDEDGASVRLEGLANFIERKSLSVGCFDDLNGTAKGLGQCFPAFTELSGGEDEHSVSG